MNFTVLPAFEHEAVVLRPMEKTDITPWYEYLRLPEVFEHTSWDVHSPEELIHYAWRPEEFSVSSALRFAIAFRSTNRLVGTAGFHTVSPKNRTAEIAYDLAPDVWGTGIATAVCRELVRWAHSSAGIIRVQASVLHSNERSAKVLERCGFMKEGLLRSYRLVRGKPGNFYMYSHLTDVRTDV